MGDRKTFAWVALRPVGQGFADEGCPVVWSIAYSRDKAMERFADQMRSWGEAADHHSVVWRRAYRRGWRLARVSITPSHGY